MTDFPMTARNATLADLARILQSQQTAKLDAVVPAQAIHSVNGVLHVVGLGAAGPVGDAGYFRPTETCDGDLAEKLGIPTNYLRRLREQRVDLFDQNVNGWIQGSPALGPNPPQDPNTSRPAPEFSPDGRRFLLRAFSPADMFGEGVARALLSDSYRRIDHLDVLTAALSGVRDSGAEVEVVSCDLTETRMRIKVAAPAIAALAPRLLAGYRSPNGGWTIDRAREAAAREGQGYPPGQEPVVFAGFEIGNSETGGGAAVITPRLVVQMCRNGLTISADALRNIHLGGRMEADIVRWSDATQEKNLELITSMARDAVATFLDKGYVEAALDRIEAKASTEMKNPVEAVEVVAKQLRFSEETTKGVLNAFIRGGQSTAGGILNAVTAFAQEVENADLSAELEAIALQALEIAAA